MKRRSVKVIVLILTVVLIITMGLIWILIINNTSSKNKTKDTNKKKVIKKEHRKEYKASLIMVGDALIHSNIYLDAKNEDGSYDFKPMLEYTKPIIEQYDLKYYNQETILGG